MLRLKVRLTLISWVSLEIEGGARCRVRTCDPYRVKVRSRFTDGLISLVFHVERFLVGSLVGSGFRG